MTSHWKHCCVRIPQRWVLAVMGSLGIMNAYMMRISLSLAITQMARPIIKSINHTKFYETCPSYAEPVSSDVDRGGTYDWDEYTQGVILSSFFWGYVISQIPSGICAARYGGKYVLGLGIFFTSLLTVLTPLVVEAYDSTGLIIIRAIMGVVQGLIYPAVTVMISKWAPPHERSKITAVVMTGSQVGSILGTALTGVFIKYFRAGWSLVFYIFGGVGILWFVAWVILCYSTPYSHPFISEREKIYLHETLNEHAQKRKPPTPWRHIVSSLPVWAILLGKFGRDWGFQLMITNLPKYMSDVLKFSIHENGFLSALPNAVMWIAGIVSSWIADYLIKADKMSTTNVRKLFTSIASIGPAVFMIAASYAGCDRIVVVIYFTASVGLMGSLYAGLMVNPIDLSPNHSGTLMAIANAVGAFAGVLAPYSVGILTPNQTIYEWRLVFWITFVMFCLSNLIFVVWADGNVQSWNNLAPRIDSLKVTEKRKEIVATETFLQSDKL